MTVVKIFRPVVRGGHVEPEVSHVLRAECDAFPGESSQLQMLY